MENFELFYIVLCNLSIVNVWQKVLTYALESNFDGKIFRQQGQAIAENHHKDSFILIKAWKM